MELSKFFFYSLAVIHALYINVEAWKDSVKKKHFANMKINLIGEYESCIIARHMIVTKSQRRELGIL